MNIIAINAKIIFSVENLGKKKRKPAGHVVNPKSYGLLRKACSLHVVPTKMLLDQECPHVEAHSNEAPM